MATTTATAHLSFAALFRDVTIDSAKRTEVEPEIRQRLDLPTANLKVAGAIYNNIAPSTTTVLDLDGGLTDSDGAAINFTSINVIVVRNRRTDAGAHVDVGPDSTAGFGAAGFWADATDRSRVAEDGGILYLYSKAGVTVTPSTAHELALITSAVAGSTNAFDVLVAGTV